MSRSRGRTGRPWRRVLAEVKATESVCWLCGKLIDLRLPPRHPMSFSVDHVVPLMSGGATTDRANLRAAHLSCNVARSNRLRGELARAVRLRTSRRW